MKKLFLVLTLLITLGAEVHSEQEITIIDRDGKTSHPLIQCFVDKELPHPDGVYCSYGLILPRGFTDIVAIVIHDAKGVAIFDSALAQRDGIFHDLTANGVRFLLKKDHVPATWISFSGVYEGEAHDYKLSLILPENKKPNKAEMATPRKPSD